MVPGWVTSLLAILKTAAVLLGWIKSEQDRQRGREEVAGEYAKAEAEAERRMSEIAAEGQSNEQTQADLNAGKL